MTRGDVRDADRFTRVTSTQNEAIRLIRALLSTKGRRRERAFIVEGQRAVADAINIGQRPRLVLFRGDLDLANGPIGSLAENIPRSVGRIVDPFIFDGVAQTMHSQGVLAVFLSPDLPIPAVRAPLYLVADQIRDPGNLGTLIRSAAAAGCTTIFFTEGTVDPLNPKVVRAAMGAHFRVPIKPFDDVAIAHVAACPLRALAEADAGPPPDGLDWTQPAALFVGGEADGPGVDVQELASVTTSIPLATGVESLNAAVAGSVILFEAQRQRRRGHRRSVPPPFGTDSDKNHDSG